MLETTKEKEYKNPFKLPKHSLRDGTKVWNDCDELFAMVPKMKRTEKFRLSHQHYFLTKERFGSEVRGDEITSRTPRTGNLTFTASFSLEYVNSIGEGRVYNICAFTGMTGELPNAERVSFDGENGAEITLHGEIEQNGVWVPGPAKDKMIYTALMLSRQVEGNVTGAKNYNSRDYDIIRVNEEAILDAKIEVRDLARKADRAMEEIEADLDLLLTLAKTISDDYPYTGAKTLNAMRDFLAPFVDTKPELVIEKIKNLDVNRIKVDISDAIDRGIIVNDNTAKGWMFGKRKGTNKGIVNYLESDSPERQRTILESFLTSDAGTASKAYLRQALDKEKAGQISE